MSRRNSHAIDSQLRQIDAIFRSNEEPHVVTIVDVKKDKNCDFHRNSPSRRGSVEIINTKNNNNNGLRKGSVSPRMENRKSFCSTDKLNDKMLKKNGRNSIASFTELINHNHINGLNGRNSVDQIDGTSGPKKRNSMSITEGSNGYKKDPRNLKGIEHPSNFPNTLRSSQTSAKNGNHDASRRASSSWNVNHFHNYTNGTSSNLDRRQSLSTSEKIYRRDYLNGGSSSNTSSPEPKKELHSILKPNNGRKNTSDEELKEIIKRLSFEYIEEEMTRNGNKIDVDLLSNSDSSSGGGGTGRNFTSTKLAPRRISIDSLESSSRRSSRRFSDFSVNSDDFQTFRTTSRQQPLQVSEMIACSRYIGT
jgi:hypothetical protein